MLKNLPAMQETWIPSQGQEDPLEKEMATHSSVLAWRRATVHGVTKSRTHLSDFHLHPDFGDLKYSIAGPRLGLDPVFTSYALSEILL